VLLGAGNAAGGYAVTDRMLAMFKTSDAKPKPATPRPRQGPSSQEEKLRTPMLILAPNSSSARRSRAAFLFMFGLKRMSSPATAPSGIRVAGVGMVAAVLASFLYLFTVERAARPHLMVNIGLAVTALADRRRRAWFVGRQGRHDRHAADGGDL
jgi:hypothetical protein